MPTVEPNASWNPAFMPNSIEDPVATKPIVHESSLQLAPEPVLETSKPEYDAPGPILDEGLDSVNDAKFSEQKEANGPESMPEDAPSAFVSEGAGLNGHNGFAEPDSSERPEVSTYESPSKNKHLSTMSFARTVSEDVNWGEDDEVDPEWNLQPAEKDPFDFMPPTNRTNSFPAVPARETHEELPHSQAEQIMNEVELEQEGESRELFATEGEDPEATFFNNTSAPQESHADLVAEGQQESGDWFPDYGQAHRGHPREEEAQEAEARFEEGLPLVQHEDSHNPHQEQAADRVHFTDDEPGDDEEDFFTQASKANLSENAEVPEPNLERKSMMQVMGSMNFQAQEQVQDIVEEAISPEDIMQDRRSSLDRATGGGLGASRSTVFSAILGDSDAAIHGEPENLANLIMDSGDGDLAAKWKAALAGDEFLDDDDDDLLPDDDEPVDEPAEKSAMDPSVLFADDGEGFLEDDDQDLLAQHQALTQISHSNGQAKAFEGANGSTHTQATRPSSGNRYLPAGAAINLPSSTNSYAPAAPNFTDLSKPTNSRSTTSPYASPTVGTFQLPARPEMQPKAQSFANQSKGGYSSPYDLPMEVVKPRKRVSMQQIKPSSGPAPPPRSASMYGQAAPPVAPPSMPTPPTSSQGYAPSPLNQQAPAAPSGKVVRKSQSGFFEDLPMASRPKPAARHSTAFPSPAPIPYGAPGSGPPPLPSSRNSYAPPPVSQHPVQPPQSFATPPPSQGLVAPPKVSPYASLPTGSAPAPATASRYSPAPPSLVHSNTVPPPASQSRYSPAPPSLGRNAASYAAPPVSHHGPPPVLAHQPRTSSPLAHFERNSQQSTQTHMQPLDRRSSSSGYESNLRSTQLSPTREADEYEQLQSPSRSKAYGDLQTQSPPQPILQPQQAMRHTPPPPQGAASRSVTSPPKRQNYQPQQPTNGALPQIAAPQRSQTQSPGSMFAGAPKAVPYQRPASTEFHQPPRPAAVGYPPVTAPQGRARGFSQVNHVVPTDGREHDPLHRWRGSPVFAWGVGGTIVTSFPVEVPRYSSTSTTPMIIRSQGQVKIRSIKDIHPLQQRLSSFPGPLKGKSKKKEVIAWLTSGIELLEQEAAYLKTLAVLSHEDKRMEERILLWKILRVFIEHDGALEGSPVVQKAVRAVLSPGVDDDQNPTDAPLYATGAELSGISQSSSTATRADPVDPAAVDQLRKHLLKGDREKAVWEAVDKRLWAHAMLISNTVSRELYKQVAQEFVQKEVKIIGENTQSLAALYEIFAGNFEESIDELVPPSARAGFQMISTKNTAGATNDALNGLDRWRETLGLVLSNRSTDDSQALTALGKLLSGYGRAEAAHICFLFARSTSLFGGIDDPATSIVLVGSDHLRQPFDFDRELEPVLLSEVFEYGKSLASITGVAPLGPHLAVYKLQHAKILAEYGFRDKALMYCEAIAVSITSQTRRSPYHHTLLTAELEDLSKRLKALPKDDSGSWISKPSMDKAKGSVWATFNKFVAGEESDASAPGSTSSNDVGPFARIAGGTPTISRPPSAELYSSYNSGQNMNGGAAPMQIPSTKAASRYAPGASFTPGSHEPPSASTYGSQPRKSMEERTSSEFNRYEPQRQMSGMSDNYRPTSQPNNGPSSNSYTPQITSNYTPQSSYTPLGTESPYEPSYAPHTPLTDKALPNMYSSPQSLNNLDSQQPQAPIEHSYSQESSNGYAPPSHSFDSPSTGHEPPSSGGYEPPSSGGYEPPSSGYEPPSYEPTTMGDEPDSPVETKPKKKSFMDDDDDDIPALKNPPSTREKTKAEKDREADEAFRRAAEADAQKSSSAAPAKKGWGLGGWFGGGAAKKEPDMSAAATNKPIRAKLGEASSFVYDPDLKRWVNKKPGAEQTESKGAAPPPPRMGPPRTASVPPMANAGMMTPPVGGPTSAPRTPAVGGQRAVSDSVASPLIASSGNAASDAGGIGLGPPVMTRSVSNSSGPPGVSALGAGGASGPPSRPGTSMSNASSIDDLLGPPTAGGSTRGAKKGKKKGRGYVDVMGGEK